MERHSHTLFLYCENGTLDMQKPSKTGSFLDNKFFNFVYFLEFLIHLKDEKKRNEILT